ncbi:hypothetical protein GJ744_004621 [Endocarpon pusillum]|uniref:DUF3752 domain-containing protein n=1 Tax=Endocarpon pusillum TaxID=364733 RepID=A0A8H7AR38_9EURO|nr:hypothetical protein GJ744_004621 [Endocarpon pusillum]
MPSVGPGLPPANAAKRKRDARNEDDETIPHSPQSLASGSNSPSTSAKKPRTIGPTLPPASLDERPTQPPEREADSSSDDDDFGPSLPTVKAQKLAVATNEASEVTADDSQPPAPMKSMRDEWMIVPPSSDDWSARVDPTKLKNRKFNTGKGSKAPAQNTGQKTTGNWTETPDERKSRLQREMMGIKDISVAKDSPRDDATARENARKLREYNEQSRGSTLYTEHQKTNPQEKEDDPSARAFDREKDIAGGMRINHTQRKALVNKAADFGSRFSSGKFL